eukprot:752821-Hanusia_phi.AAC.3
MGGRGSEERTRGAGGKNRSARDKQGRREEEGEEEKRRACVKESNKTGSTSQRMFDLLVKFTDLHSASAHARIVDLNLVGEDNEVYDRHLLHSIILLLLNSSQHADRRSAMG